MQPSKPSAESPLTGLPAIWQSRSWRAWALFPLSLLFASLAAVRRLFYRLGWQRVDRLPVPVVVVGNLIAGGAGKTPLTLYLACALQALGRRPGIVSRGYGRGGDGVAEVTEHSLPGDCGDEPVLLRQRSGVPVFVARRRGEAAKALLAAYPECDVILCDDGLQHYGLARDVELVVFDQRGVMNGLPLPAGPLREPLDRLKQAQAVVINGADLAPALQPVLSRPWLPPVFHMRLLGRRFYRLGAPAVTVEAADLLALKLHAVAGIGHPQRFFDQLRALGLSFEAHAFPDHFAYTLEALNFQGDGLLTTEKDAVKFAPLLSSGLALPVWVLPVDAHVEPDLARLVLEKIDGRPSA